MQPDPWTPGGGPPADGAVASVRRVTYRYGAGAPALADVDLEIRAGEAFAILGPNGAGKTTLIRVLLGLLTPVVGEVRLFGEPPARAVRRGRVAAMLQGSSLPAFATPSDLLRLWQALYPNAGDTSEAAEAAGIGAFLGRSVTALSGGQRRRVEFALALAAGTEFLFLDEPTEGMDIEGRAQLWERIRTHAAGAHPRTVVFTTHDLSEADRFADRVLLLAGGRVRTMGTPEELKTALSQPRVRFRASAPTTAGELSARLGLVVRDAPDRAFEIADPDTDGVIRTLVRRGGDDLSGYRIERGTLDDVFLSLTGPQSDRTADMKDMKDTKRETDRDIGTATATGPETETGGGKR